MVTGSWSVNEYCSQRGIGGLGTGPIANMTEHGGIANFENLLLSIIKFPDLPLAN